MKKFIKENWGFLFIGILNLVCAFIVTSKWLVLLNSCIGSSIVTAFVIFCMLYYYNDKMHKDVTTHKETE